MNKHQRKLLGYRGHAIADCALPPERFNTRALLHPVLVPVNLMRSLFEPLPNPTVNRVRNATILGYDDQCFS